MLGRQCLELLGCLLLVLDQGTLQLLDQDILPLECLPKLLVLKQNQLLFVVIVCVIVVSASDVMRLYVVRSAGGRGGQWVLTWQRRQEIIRLFVSLMAIVGEINHFGVLEYVLARHITAIDCCQSIRLSTKCLFNLDGTLPNGCLVRCFTPTSFAKRSCHILPSAFLYLFDCFVESSHLVKLFFLKLEPLVIKSVDKLAILVLHGLHVVLSLLV